MLIAITTRNSTLFPLHPRPPFSSPPIASFHRSLISLKNPNLKPSLIYINFQVSYYLSIMASSFIAEYAKSGRSTCKTCSETIATNTLRFGVVTKDKQRGYEMTKWHHFQCLSLDSQSISSVESIRGFDSLKSDDQEAVKKVVEERCKVKDIADEDETARDKHESAKKRKSRDADEVDVGEEQGNPNKLWLSMTDNSKVALEASEIKNMYMDAVLLPKWRAFHTVIFLEKDDGLEDTSKIAAFDFDGCLAKTDVKRTGADAWELMYPSIPGKLQELYNDGYKLVIFTNESNIDRWKNKRQKAVDSKIGRLNNFIKLVKVPIQVFIACGFGPKDQYRKPKTGMWHLMEQHFNSGIPVDMDNWEKK
ncbi:polynucleotide 3'-phosphatase ZDP isoform X3 [Amaranthus tricolor]|uniref:polynucleotide 3'-phosphatase ZDP isoform X3 n=1 Tax=Amaranthus tricolor TaxID=29722 RepID=UPI00258C5B96|nr:polynucleotide 3'-phosphatase ZDP isoform X3 [Amaranthus tricolor]